LSPCREVKGLLLGVLWRFRTQQHLQQSAYVRQRDPVGRFFFLG